MIKYIVILLLIITSIFSQEGYIKTSTFGDGDGYFINSTPVLPCNYIDTFHVPVGGYVAIGHTTNLTVKEAINVGQQYRLRQNGTVTGAGGFCATTTGATSLQIFVARKIGSYYTKIGSSENILTYLTAGQTFSVTFTRPITGCQEGDYYGVIYGAVSSPLQGIADANCTLRYISGTSDSVNYNWDGQSGIAYGIPLTLYMLNSNIVVLADSRGGVSCLSTTINNAFSTSLAYKIGHELGYTYQNMSIPSNSSGQGVARVNPDMVDLHPTLGVVLFNTNDIVGGVSSNTIVANNQTIVETMAGNHIRPYFIEDLPNGNLTNAQQRQADSCRSRIETIVLANGGYVIHTVNTFGMYSDTGDVGNKWWFNPLYSDDKVHPNSLGMDVLTSLVTSSIRSHGCPSYDIPVTILTDTTYMEKYWTYQNALGTITNWESIRDGGLLTQTTSVNKPVNVGTVKFDTLTKISGSVNMRNTALSLEFIVKFTDTNSYNNQTVAGIRYSTDTLTVLTVSLFKNSSAPVYKFITSYYAGGGYYDKDYSSTALFNKFVHVVITADRTDKVKVYFNGVLQTVGATTINNSYNGNGLVTIGETTNGMKNAYFKMFAVYRQVLSASRVLENYNIFNSAGWIDH